MTSILHLLWPYLLRKLSIRFDGESGDSIAIVPAERAESKRKGLAGPRGNHSDPPPLSHQVGSSPAQFILVDSANGAADDAMSDDALRRRRGGTPGPKKAPASPASPAAAGPVKPPVKGQPTWWNAQPEDRRWNLILAVFLCFGIATRFWKISLPHEVVFDEVHFGKFASYYLRGTYFFDVHPPFGKLMIAGVGWLAGYRGHFEFENIGDDYLKHNVPYVALRSLSAILGGLLVPLVVDFGRRLGFGMGASVLAGAMVLFGGIIWTLRYELKSLLEVPLV